MPPAIYYTAPGIREGEGDGVQFAVLDIQRVITSGVSIEAQLVERSLTDDHTTNYVAAPVSGHDLRSVAEGTS